MKRLTPFLFIILLISACTPAQEIPVGINVKTPVAPIVVPNVIEEIEPVVEAVEPIPPPTDNSTLAEATREAKYGTLVDLTQLTAINCEDTLEDLDEQLSDELYEEENVKDDISDQLQKVAKAEDVLDDARSSGGERDIIRAKDDLEKEENDLTDFKNERYKAHRKIIDIKETIGRVEPRCMALTKGKYR